MTYQQVLDQIESGEIIASALNWYGEEAVRLIVRAVEKQIPKKPEYKKVRQTIQLTRELYCCPHCGERLFIQNHKELEDGFSRWPQGVKTKACPTCGQAIEWEAEP